MDGLRSGSWTIPFRILGVPVRVHLAWLLVAVLVGWSMAMGSLPVVYAGLSDRTYWAMSAMVIAGLGLSILLHEFAHTLAGRAMGISVDRITLFFFGGVAELHEEPRTALSELGMALAGPIFSVILCGVLAVAAGAAQVAGAPEAIVGSLTFVATLNLVMAVFNLLPAFPLDGGRVVRALLWMLTGDLDRATRTATGLGQILAVVLIASGAIQAVRGSLEGGLWTILIGIFLQYAARGARAEADARRQLTAAPSAG
jgi:Zn-dependent protease